MLVVATPLVKLIVAPVPKSTAAEFLSVTVGATDGLALKIAPVNTMDLSPA
ncbi:hypothetical protein AQEC111735_12010 [Aquirufa ecclesiirivi]